MNFKYTINLRLQLILFNDDNTISLSKPKCIKEVELKNFIKNKEAIPCNFLLNNPYISKRTLIKIKACIYTENNVTDDKQIDSFQCGIHEFVFDELKNHPEMNTEKEEEKNEPSQLKSSNKRKSELQNIESSFSLKKIDRKNDGNVSKIVSFENTHVVRLIRKTVETYNSNFCLDQIDLYLNVEEMFKRNFPEFKEYFGINF